MLIDSAKLITTPSTADGEAVILSLDTGGSLRVSSPTGTIYAMSTLSLAADPTVALAAATKQYVDSVAGGTIPASGGTLTGPLVLAGDPTVPLGAATKQYSDLKLPLAGGTLTGSLVGPGTAPITISSGTIAVASGQNLLFNMGGSTHTLSIAGTGGTGTLATWTANTAGNTFDTTGALLKTKFIESLPGTITYSGAFSLTGSPLAMQFLPAGTPTASGQLFPYTQIATLGDTAAVGAGNHCRLVNIDHQWGGAAMTGGRIATVTALLQTAASGNGTNDAFYSGFQTSSDMSFNEGGTGLTAATALGHQFAGNSYSRLHSGATNIYANVGWEWDIVNETGSSALRSLGMSFVHLGTHAVQGAAEDAGIIFADVTGAAGWKDIFQIGSMFAQNPVDATVGNILRWTVPSNPAVTPPAAKGGIDLSVGLCSGNAFASRNFSVAGAGTTHHFNAAIAQTSNGVSIDFPYAIGTLSSIVAGSTGNTAGMWYRDNADIPGIWQATTVVAGAPTVVAMKQAPYSASSPSTLTLTNLNTDIGGTFSLNMTWAAKNELSLQPSGGTLKAGTGMMSANGSVATAMSSLGPVGAHTTVQEWFTITNAAGAVRFIPAF